MVSKKVGGAFHRADLLDRRARGGDHPAAHKVGELEWHVDEVALIRIDPMQFDERARRGRLPW
jgi:hypothetical protein